jgi:Resolvase, N terminal domain
MLADLRKRKFDVILVWALDRLARSIKQLLTIAEECRSLGVDLVSLRQSIDTTLPAGRLTFQILGAVAEFEKRTAARASEGWNGTGTSDRKACWSTGAAQQVLPSCDAARTQDRESSDGAKAGGTSVLDVAPGLGLRPVAKVWFARRSARKSRWCAVNHRRNDWASHSPKQGSSNT